MWRHPDGRDEWAMAIMGAWLRDWRWETGATQRQLAKLAGVDQAHISRIENGLRRPSGIPLARLIIALDWLATADGVGRPFGSLERNRRTGTIDGDVAGPPWSSVRRPRTSRHWRSIRCS